MVAAKWFEIRARIDAEVSGIEHRRLNAAIDRLLDAVDAGREGVVEARSFERHASRMLAGVTRSWQQFADYEKSVADARAWLDGLVRLRSGRLVLDFWSTVGNDHGVIVKRIHRAEPELSGGRGA